MLFQLTFPMVKEDRKIKKRDEESKEDWKQRKKAYYQALGANDFTFREIPLEKNQIIIKVVEDAVKLRNNPKYIPYVRWCHNPGHYRINLYTLQSN